MPMKPRVVERAEQPYVAIGGVVTMRTIGAVADRLPEVFGWLGERGIEPARAPFLRYHVIDMDGELDVEAAVPVAAAVDGSGEILAGVLPAGRYVTVSHVGHPDGLLDLTRAVLEWAAERGLRWDMSETDGGQRWGGRVEVFKTDPRQEPDPHNWETELALRLSD